MDTSAFDDFAARYTLVANREPHAEDYPQNCLFETFAPDVDFVRRQNERQRWTLIDGEDGRTYLTAGYHFVNRLGYFITVEEWASEDEQYAYSK